MQITGYDGFDFSTLTMAGELPLEQGAGWQINQIVVPRGPAFPVLGASQPSVYTVDVEFVYTGSRTDYWQLFGELAGKLNPADQSPRRKLLATRPDGTAVWRYAKITMPAWWTDEDTNSVTVRFVSSDPRWHAVTPKTVAPFGDAGLGGAPWVIGKNTPGIAVPNAGLMPVHPVIEVPAGGVVVGTGGWRYRRKQTITNNLPRSVQNIVLMFELGDTASWVTAGQALASGDDLRVIGPNGNEVPRDLVAWNTLGSKVYAYIRAIAPGESQTYDILYGNAVAGPPLTLAYPYKPAFLTDWVWSANAGSSDGTNTWIRVGTVPPVGTTAGDWAGLQRDNKYTDSALIFLSGANAGVGRKIASTVYNSTFLNTTINFTSAFPNTIASTDDWLIISSRNGVWIYDVQSDYSRGGDYARGRWYSSSGESPPDLVSYEVPGSWSPYLYKDGRDKHGQSSYSRLTHGGDLDTYTILNAQRSWENGAVVAEEGIADGVSLTLPFEIVDYQWDGTLVNPNGMAKGVIGVRGSGGNDWSELDSRDTVGAAVAWGTGGLVFPTGRNILQLYHGLIPYEGDEIEQSWYKDNGSSSIGGTTTTLIDATKNWRTDQWAGAQLRFTGGRRSGLLRTITGNTPTVITFTPAIGNNTRVDQPYEIIRPKLRAQLIDGKRCTVTYAETGFVIGSLGAEEFISDISARLWFGGGPLDSSVISGQRRVAVELGKAAGVFLPVKESFEFLQIDSSLRSVELRDYATRTVQRRYTDPQTRFRYTDDLGVEQASQNGMPLPVGVNRLANPSAETGIITSWTATSSGTIGAALSQEATLHAVAQGGSKSFKINITSSTGGAYFQIAADDRVAIGAGALAQVSGWVRTTHADLRPRLGIAFYDAGGALIATDLQASIAQTPNYWLAEAHAAIAPANSASYSVVGRATVATGTPTGSVYFDDFDIGSPVLFIRSDRNFGTALRVLFTESYLL